MPSLKIAPSILSADFGKLNAEIATVEPYADLIHVDVMDGHFVPNLTIGPPVVRMIKSKLPLDCHLMIEKPEKFLADFAKAGAAIITVHAEVCAKNLKEVISKIKALGCQAGVSINPETSIDLLTPVLDMLDMVLVMTVNPGFAGQGFIASALPKITALRKLKPELDIEVDGGINAETVKAAREAGANVIVAGSYIFGASDRQAAIESLRL